MKRIIGAAEGVCSIAALVTIYMTVMKAVEGADVLPYGIASVSITALAVSTFCISSLIGRVERLELDVRGLLDDGYEQEDRPMCECPVCHASYDADEGICPYCGGEKSAPGGGEYFATEDPDYKGTDYSREPYVSANTDGADDRQNNFTE